MTSLGDGCLPQDLHWRKLYEAAILEADLVKLPHRIEEAKKAIYERMAELALSDQNGHWEELMDAIRVLEDVLKMQNASQSLLTQRKSTEHQE